LLTGRHPLELGLVSNLSALPDGVPTLASALRERGWQTAAVVSNYVLRGKTGLAVGFDHFDDTMQQREAVRGWPERTATDTTDAALRACAALVEAADAGWLLWVHYQDPHGPYTPPGERRAQQLAIERDAPGGDRVLAEPPDAFGHGAIPAYQALEGRRDVAFYRAGYHAEIAYTDEEIGRLLDTLERRGWLDGAAIVFAADHGEALGEHDYWFAHGHHLTDELVRVPLFLHVPGRTAERRADVVALVDVFPTLLRLLTGVPARADSAGRDLLAPGAERRHSVAFFATLSAGAEPRFGFVEGGYKYIATLRDGMWRSQLFRSGREEVDLSAPAPQLAGRMRRRLETLRLRYDRGATERRQVLSVEDAEKLRALGYVEELVQ
jgi:arylsulfatase